MKKSLSALMLAVPTLCLTLGAHAATVAGSMPNAPDAGDMSFVGYMVIGLAAVATLLNRKR